MPKHKAMNPDDYFNFFSKWGDIVSVTVATDNGKLLKAMTENRELDEKIEAKRVTDLALEAEGKKVLTQADLTEGQVSVSELKEKLRS